MGNNPKILCVIPARGGSKGIRNKNIKKLTNKRNKSWLIETNLV